ncbi:MAG: hypothetical protein ACHQUC_02415 [Chlamydiales bacterium]
MINGQTPPNYRPRPTKGEGDCAFHAIFGTWNGKQFECQDVLHKRSELASQIKRPQLDREISMLAKNAIVELVMERNGSVGPRIKSIMEGFQHFVDENQNLSKQLWNAFQEKLQHFPEIINAINDFYNNLSSEEKDPIDPNTAIPANNEDNPLNSNENGESSVRNIDSQDTEHQASTSSAGIADPNNFKLKFDTYYNHDNELERMILSDLELNGAYQEYKKCSETNFWDTDPITPEVLEEYADNIGTKGRWLTQTEIKLIAHIFDISIASHTKKADNKTTLLGHYKPGKEQEVVICFSDQNHFERMVDPAIPANNEDNSLNSNKNGGSSVRNTNSQDTEHQTSTSSAGITVGDPRNFEGFPLPAPLPQLQLSSNISSPLKEDVNVFLTRKMHLDLENGFGKRLWQYIKEYLIQTDPEILKGNKSLNSCELFEIQLLEKEIEIAINCDLLATVLTPFIQDKHQALPASFIQYMMHSRPCESTLIDLKKLNCWMAFLINSDAPLKVREETAHFLLQINQYLGKSPRTCTSEPHRDVVREMLWFVQCSSRFGYSQELVFQGIHRLMNVEGARKELFSVEYDLPFVLEAGDKMPDKISLEQLVPLIRLRDKLTNSLTERTFATQIVILIRKHLDDQFLTHSNLPLIKKIYEYSLKIANTKYTHQSVLSALDRQMSAANFQENPLKILEQLGFVENITDRGWGGSIIQASAKVLPHRFTGLVESAADRISRLPGAGVIQTVVKILPLSERAIQATASQAKLHELAKEDFEIERTRYMKELMRDHLAEKDYLFEEQEEEFADLLITKIQEYTLLEKHREFFRSYLKMIAISAIEFFIRTNLSPKAAVDAFIDNFIKTPNVILSSGDCAAKTSQKRIANKRITPILDGVETRMTVAIPTTPPTATAGDLLTYLRHHLAPTTVLIIKKVLGGLLPLERKKDVEQFNPLFELIEVLIARSGNSSIDHLFASDKIPCGAEAKIFYDSFTYLLNDLPMNAAIFPKIKQLLVDTMTEQFSSETTKVQALPVNASVKVIKAIPNSPITTFVVALLLNSIECAKNYRAAQTLALANHEPYELPTNAPFLARIFFDGTLEGISNKLKWEKIISTMLYACSTWWGRGLGKWYIKGKIKKNLLNSSFIIENTSQREKDLISAQLSYCIEIINAMDLRSDENQKRIRNLVHLMDVIHNAVNSPMPLDNKQLTIDILAGFKNLINEIAATTDIGYEAFRSLALLAEQSQNASLPAPTIPSSLSSASLVLVQSSTKPKTSLSILISRNRESFDRNMTDEEARHLLDKMRGSFCQLNLSKCKNLSNETLRAFAEKCQDLTVLNLSGTQATHETLMAFFEKCHNLEELDLSDTQATTETLMAFARISNHHLKKLRLRNLKITDDAPLIEFALNCPMLTELVLMGIGANIFSQRAFAEYCHNLKIVDLRETDTDQSIIRCLIQKNAKTLRKLFLTRTYGFFQHCENVESLKLKYPKLELKYYKGRYTRYDPIEGVNEAIINSIPYSGYNRFPSIHPYPEMPVSILWTHLDKVLLNDEETLRKNYREIRVKSNPYSMHVHMDITSFLQITPQLGGVFEQFGPQLRGLHLEGLNCIETLILYKQNFPLLTQLTHLILRNFKELNNEALLVFARNCKILRYLDLSGTQVSTETLMVFGLNCPWLTTLILSHTNASNEALIAFAQNCRGLSTLKLKGIQVSNEALITFAKNSPGLLSLSLEDTNASDEAFKIFLNNCRCLHSVNVSNTQINQGSINELFFGRERWRDDYGSSHLILAPGQFSKSFITRLSLNKRVSVHYTQSKSNFCSIS